MPDIVFGQISTIIFGLVAAAASALYIREYSVRKKTEKDSKASPSDKANYQSIQQLTTESQKVVTDARENADKLVGEVKEFEAKATQDFGQSLNNLLEEEKKQTEQAATAANQEMKLAEQQFDQFLKDLTKVMDNKTQASITQFNAYLEALKAEGQKTQTANWEGARVRVAELFESFETKLADFLLQTEQKMMLSVDLELKSARQLIDTYKVQQMNIIDENIMAMLEKTLSLVLAKNLNLKDQMDFVYESLEKAKAEKFLV